MPDVMIRGTRLEVRERGEGEPVVLVHGSASDLRTWDGRQAVLAEEFRTIAYSRRYHWPNPKIEPGADYSMAEHASDLRALVDTFVGGPVHLVGHSYGAYVCLLACIEDPALARSLVLAEPPVVPLALPLPPRPLGLLRLLARSPRTGLAILRFVALGVAPATAALKRGDRERALERFGRATLGADAFRQLEPARWQQARDNFIDMELLGSGFPPIDPGDVRRVQAPALLVVGQKSPAIFPRLCDRLEALLPDVRRAEIPGASHLSHEDNPEAYDAAVLPFLRRHRRAAG